MEIALHTLSYPTVADGRHSGMAPYRGSTPIDAWLNANIKTTNSDEYMKYRGYVAVNSPPRPGVS